MIKNLLFGFESVTYNANLKMSRIIMFLSRIVVLRSLGMILTRTWLGQTWGGRSTNMARYEYEDLIFQRAESPCAPLYAESWGSWVAEGWVRCSNNSDCFAVQHVLRKESTTEKDRCCHDAAALSTRNVVKTASYLVLNTAA